MLVDFQILSLPRFCKVINGNTMRSFLLDYMHFYGYYFSASVVHTLA